MGVEAAWLMLGLLTPTLASPPPHILVFLTRATRVLLAVVLIVENAYYGTG